MSFHKSELLLLVVFILFVLTTGSAGAALMNDAATGDVRAVNDLDVGTDLRVSGTTTVTGTSAMNGNVTLGDAAADTINVLGNTTYDDSTTVSINSSSIGLGNAASDTLTVTGIVDLGASTLANENALVLEGASVDGFETTLSVTDPTADRNIALPDNSGTLALVQDILNNVTVLADNSNHVVGSDLTVTDEDGGGGTGDSVEVNLFSGGIDATGAEAVRIRLLSISPTAEFLINASDGSSTATMRGYGGANGQQTISTNCGAPTAIGTTGLRACLNNAGSDRLELNAINIPGLTDHAVEISVITKANDNI